MTTGSADAARQQFPPPRPAHDGTVLAPTRPLPPPALHAAATVSPLAAAPGLARAGRGGVVPPMEFEVGQATLASEAGPRVLATQLQAGLSWAALMPSPTPVDVTVGWIAILGPGSDAASGSTPMARAAVPVVRDAHGAYLDVAVTIGRTRHVRGWLSGRGEVLTAGSAVLTGVAARVQTELWAPVATTHPGSFMVGTFGLSLWAELGVRGRAGDHLGATTAAGLGVRLPFIVAY